MALGAPLSTTMSSRTWWTFGVNWPAETKLHGNEAAAAASNSNQPTSTSSFSPPPLQPDAINGMRWLVGGRDTTTINAVGSRSLMQCAAVQTKYRPPRDTNVPEK